MTFLDDYSIVPSKTIYVPGRHAPHVNKELLARLRYDLRFNENRLKEVQTDKSLSAQEKDKKVRHIQETIKNLNQTIQKMDDLLMADALQR